MFKNIHDGENARCTYFIILYDLGTFYVQILAKLAMQ